MRSGDPVRRLGLAVARTAPFFAAVAALDRVLGDRPGTFTILTYHRIADPGERPDLAPWLVSATPATFAAQMELLARRCRVVDMAALVAARRGERALPSGAVLVTFDDAYRDVADHAWPTLRRLGLPATLFVPTAFADDPSRAFWWDRVHHAVTGAPDGATLPTPSGDVVVRDADGRARLLRSLRRELKALPHERALVAVDALASASGAGGPAPATLGWPDLARLDAEGLTLAPHSLEHPLLTRVSRERAVTEIAGSLATLREHVPDVPAVFAYPGGAVDERVAAAAAAAGIEVAVTTRRGRNDASRADWLLLRRVNVGARTSLGLVQAQLLGWPRHPGGRP